MGLQLQDHQQEDEQEAGQALLKQGELCLTAIRPHCLLISASFSYIGYILDIIKDRFYT